MTRFRFGAVQNGGPRRVPTVANLLSTMPHRTALIVWRTRRIMPFTPASDG